MAYLSCNTYAYASQVIHRSISDENSHFPPEIIFYISDYIKHLKLKKSSGVKFCSSIFKSSYIFE